MDRRARLFAPLLAVALILVTGMGAYSYSLQHRLDDTLNSIGALEQDRNIWKSKAEKAAGLVDTASISLNQCSAKVENLRSLLANTSPAFPASSAGHTAE